MRVETSLVAQLLRLRFPMQGVQVQSFVGELRSYLCSKNKNKNTPKHKTNKTSILTNSVKTLKMVHLKKSFKKR